MNQFNAIAYEKIFETYGAKFWDRVGGHFRRRFLISFIRWRTPTLDEKMARMLAEPMTWYTYMEFDDQTKLDMIRFQKRYAHTKEFRDLIGHN